MAIVVVVVGVALLTGRLELPGPRYSESTDYPSRVSVALQQEIAKDPILMNQPMRVLWAWDWRWGRYCATVQVWGVATQEQQARLIQHLREIKSTTPDHRTIKVEFLEMLPDAPDLKNNRVVGRQVF